MYPSRMYNSMYLNSPSWILILWCLILFTHSSNSFGNILLSTYYESDTIDEIKGTKAKSLKDFNSLNLNCHNFYYLESPKEH